MRLVIISLFSTGLYAAKQRGISVSAEIREASNAKIIVEPNGLNICPESPFIVASGT